MFDAIVEDVRAARSSIHVVTYIWRGEDQPSRRVGRGDPADASAAAGRGLPDPARSLRIAEVRRRAWSSGCDRPAARCAGTTGGRCPIRWRATTARSSWWTARGRSPAASASTARGWATGARPSSGGTRRCGCAGPVVADLQRAFEQNWREVTGQALPRSAYPAAGAGGRRPGDVHRHLAHPGQAVGRRGHVPPAGAGGAAAAVDRQLVFHPRRAPAAADDRARAGRRGRAGAGARARCTTCRRCAPPSGPPTRS